MTETKQTPGPWDVDHIPAEGNNRALFYSGTKDTPDFRVVFANDMPQAESKAIRALLHAAPAMLEALRYIDNHCRELWAQDERYRAGIAYILDAAEPAIARAEGNSVRAKAEYSRWGDTGQAPAQKTGQGQSH